MTSVDTKQVELDVAISAASSVSAKKILLVANTGWYLFNFRRNLIHEMQQAGFSVAVVCPKDNYVERLVGENVRWIPWQIDRSSMNPVGNVTAVAALSRIYRVEAPDLVHHFTIKSILYGTLAAKKARIRSVVNSVTGLGHVFLSQRLIARMIRPGIRRWYTWSLTTEGVRAVFQNSDDLKILAANSPKLANAAILTRGSGVDLDRFSPSNESPNTNGQATVLFAGRLLQEKGIREFVEAARVCRQRGGSAHWVVCGSADVGNPSSVDAKTLESWKLEGVVEFVGHVDRMETQLARADVVVLPSYREGTPRVLLEAAATGKPVVATDVPGCREVVSDGENGFLVPPRDATALADAIQRLVADERLRISMGAAGRQRVERQFDECDVVAQMLDLYNELLHGEEKPQVVRVKNALRSSDRWTLLPPCPLDQGAFVISLDFELAWGTRGRPAASRVGDHLDGAREAIQQILRLFERYEIPATWAIVGSLLMGRAGNRERHAWLAEDEFSDVPVGNSSTEPRWYAEDILEWLRDHPGEQEIACHTLTHRFVDPTPEGRERFRQDLRRFRQLFDEHYLPQPTSFIFPKAKMAHLDVLVEEGFRCIRGPEDKWFESLPGTLLPAGLRLVDARWAARPKVGLPRQTTDGLWVLPSSQFYSPLMSVGKHVSVPARVRKAVKGLRQAAGGQRLYHLWTHPFNMGVGTDELLAGLEQILQEACRLRSEGKLEILTMAQLTDRVARPLEGEV